MAAKRIAGVVYFKIDGEQLECTGSLQVPLNTKVRESVLGQTKVAGYKETLRAGYISGAFAFDADFPVEKVTEGEDMTITAELANGKTYVLSGAYLVDESDVANDDGTVELRFEGDGEYQ
ncbi:phage tail tube protein [Methylobacillus pratensis]